MSFDDVLDRAVRLRRPVTVEQVWDDMDEEGFGGGARCAVRAPAPCPRTPPGPTSNVRRAPSGVPATTPTRPRRAAAKAMARPAAMTSPTASPIEEAPLPPASRLAMATPATPPTAVATATRIGQPMIRRRQVFLGSGVSASRRTKNFGI